MDWLLTTPQISSAFSSLGSQVGDTYVVSPNALETLAEIHNKLIFEDQTLRTFRRAIGFGRNVCADLIPLLKNARNQQVLESVVRILVNLTVPVECLFSVDVMYRTEMGRHIIFDLNRLLYDSKEAFTDAKCTKSLIDYMKNILKSDTKLSPPKCDQINNCLLLLRNILHIPENNTNFLMSSAQQSANAQAVSMQNVILWNLFIQSIDKLLLHLMTSPHRSFWGVTMVQLIALMYKDQQVITLQTLLNLSFEASLEETSEENESNTSTPKPNSGDSSPMLTSDPTSDSSSNSSGVCMNKSAQERRQALHEETEATLQEVSRSISLMPAENMNNISQQIASKSKDVKATIDDDTEMIEECETKQPADQVNNTTNSTKAADAVAFKTPPAVNISLEESSEEQLSDLPSKPCQKVPHAGQMNLIKGKCHPQKRQCPSSQSEQSDCGYVTQIDNQETISTSSNDDDAPQKPQHQKPPCNSKPRNKQRTLLTPADKTELRHKKLVKRSKSSLINMKALVQHTPTDQDISNLLKEFTVDFLLKGYGYLVEELHSQLLVNVQMTIDTSHFFWLVTYFLKFAAQLELEMEHIYCVLTYDVISYLTYEGVTLSEQLELNARQEGNDLKPDLRRMHLAITAIREFLQAIETYKKVIHLNEEDLEHLQRLQMQIGTTEDLRCLFVLLLRRFNPSLHTKQFLQDLIVTNHMLLLILDGASQTNENLKIKMIDHISQFATLDIMHCYGLLLEDFTNNGEFVNDCIFTMMHHVAGDLGQISALFQPVILKTFSRIWEAEYQLCDDWSDLIEHVIHKFMNMPKKSPLTLPTATLTEMTKEHNLEHAVCTWTQEEIDTLYWYYVQSKQNNDVIGKIVQLFGNNGNTRKQKSRISIIQQLLQQDIITLIQYDDLMKFEDVEYQRALQTTPTNSTAESGIDLKNSVNYGKPADDIQMLRDLIIKEKKEVSLVWLQKLLLECCYVKLNLKNPNLQEEKQKLKYIMEPMAYHCIMKNKSIPLVQWNSEQVAVMSYQPFLLLLHKLGFQLPADAASIFASIPDFWTVEMMFSLAKKLGPLNKLLIKFDMSLLQATAEQEVHCHHATAARASLSSIFSSDVDDMTTISDDVIDTKTYNANKAQKANNAVDVFAVPKARPCHSLARFVAEPVSTPSLPNWLQLVMRGKCNLNATTATTPNNAAKITCSTTTTTATSTATTSSATNVAATIQDKLVDQDICMSIGSSNSMNSNNVMSTLLSTTSATCALNQQLLTISTVPTTSCSSSIKSFLCLNNEHNNNNNNSSSNSNNNANSSLMSNSNCNSSFQQMHELNNASGIATSSMVGTLQRQQLQLLQQQQKHEQQQQQQQQQQLVSNTNGDDDVTIKSIELNNDSSSSGFYTRRSSGISECEFFAMVSSAYPNEVDNIDTASVASDLTRMYVSDEDDQSEYEVRHYYH